MKRSAKFTPREVNQEDVPELKKTLKKSIKEDSLESKKEHFLPTVNVDVTKLPSKGLAYPKDVKISYRPYSYGEVKKVSQSKLSEVEQWDFLLNGINVDGLDKEDLTLGDVLYMAIYRKLSTLGGSKIKAVHKCGGCLEKSESIIELNSVSPNFMKAPKLPMKLNFNDGDYSFSSMTIRMYKAAYDLMLQKPDLDEEFCLMSVQCTSHEFDEVYNRFYNLSTGDEVELLSEIDDYLGHGLKPVKVKCKNLVDNKDKKSEDGPDKKECGFITDVELDGGQALLLPFREHEKSHGSRIRFGN